MEWVLPINEMLHDEITKLNYTLIPPGVETHVRKIRTIQDSLAKVINSLGYESAKAQGLQKTITTADKLRNSPAYHLYILKDALANGGKGEAIGLLKVGRKHLYLFDEQEHVREVEPLCVLDFYVAQSRQRRGLGRKLFDHMLQDMNTAPHLLAVDGPSKMMEQFLLKNYGMARLVRQNNNFAVSPQFFETNTELISQSECSTPSVASGGVGRFTARKPQSSIADVIHGGGRNNNANSESSEGLPEEVAPPPTEEAEPAEPEAEPEPAPEKSSRSAPKYEEEPRVERPCTLRVETVAAAAPATVSPAGSTTSRRESQLTGQGFFDVKFYHNKLW